MAHRNITTRFDGNGNQGVQVGLNDGSITVNELRQEHQRRSGPLSHLPYAEDAPFNARSKEHEPLCLDNTRVALLQEIHAWADRQDEPCIFWLRGLAGTGKSTIARTIARNYHNSQRLAASFFFSRGGRDVGRAGMFVTSIAVQLADNVPASQRHICEADAAHTTIASQSLRDQWQRLVLGPLSKLCDIDCPASLVLVVDALDECDSDYDVQNIVQLLTEAQLLMRVRLRVLLTSRPEVSIRNKFCKIEHRGVELQNLSPEVVARDIELFLKDQFSTLSEDECLDPDWPGEVVISSFVRKASGLFIWASTACRFIREGHPEEQLRKVIEGGIYNSILTPQAHLDGIYVTVLQASIPRNYSSKVIQKHYTSLRAVLGTIVTLFSPLSVETLSKALLFRIPEVRRILRDLHAILAIPPNEKEPLRLHHPSFRDFLLSRDRCTDANFLVDEQQAQKRLADSCIQLMSSSLEQDICKVSASGMAVAEVKSEHIEHCLPPELQYACIYWIQHLAKSSTHLRDNDIVHKFLQKHYLHWLEALGWVGKISEGIDAISSLESVAMASDCPNLYAFVHDMKRFALYSRFAIEQAPLQVYCIAIVFAPKTSLVKRQFPGKLGSLTKLPNVNCNWSAVLQTLEGHSNGVCTLAFSPDSKVLASGSYDFTTKLWEVATGAVLHTLWGRSDEMPIQAAHFSPDGKVLVTVSDSEGAVYNGCLTITLWEANTGALLQKLKCQSGFVSHMSFSPNGKELVLIQEQERVQLWDINTGKRLQRLEYYSGQARTVMFSPDGTALLLLSDSNTVSLLNMCENTMVWTVESYNPEIVDLSSDSKTIVSLSSYDTIELLDATTGAVLQTLTGYFDGVKRIALSPNGKVLVLMSDEKTSLWKVDTDTMLRTLEDNLVQESEVIFSPDSKLLLLKSSHTAKLWDVGTCTVLRNLPAVTYIGMDMIFSPDSKMLASIDGMTVNLWDAGIEMVAQTPDGIPTPTEAIVFSPDGKVLASLYHDEPMVKLWDTSMGVIVHTLNSSGDVSAVAFSHDSKRLASGSTHGENVKIWNINSGACLHTLKHHNRGDRGVMSVAFSHDSRRLASIVGNTVKVWDTDSGACLLQTFSVYERGPNAVAFSPDSKVLAFPGHHKTITLWDLDKGVLLQTLQGASHGIREVVFSRDGKTLAAVSERRAVHLWALSNERKIVNALETRFVAYSAVAFSPDGTILAAGSYDKTIKLWDVEKGVPLKTHYMDGAIYKLLFSDDAAFLLTNRGRISTGVSKSLLQRTTLPEVFVHEQWIIYRGKRELWLPPEYRAKYVAVHNNVIALGHSSGRVSFLEVAL